MKSKASEFEKEVVGAKGKVIVDFYAEWCPPCKRLAPLLEELENEGKVKVCKVDVDEEGALAMQFGVTNIPLLVLYEEGKALRSSLGYKTKAELVEFIG